MRLKSEMRIHNKIDTIKYSYTFLTSLTLFMYLISSCVVIANVVVFYLEILMLIFVISCHRN